MSVTTSRAVVPVTLSFDPFGKHPTLRNFLRTVGTSDDAKRLFRLSRDAFFTRSVRVRRRNLSRPA